MTSGSLDIKKSDDVGNQTPDDIHMPNVGPVGVISTRHIPSG